MSKALLVIDMPEKCDYCELLYHCHKDDEPYDPNAKPDWCPLRETPKKKTISQLTQEDADIYYEQGYNDCIDDILGE